MRELYRMFCVECGIRREYLDRKDADRDRKHHNDDAHNKKPVACVEQV